MPAGKAPAVRRSPATRLLMVMVAEEIVVPSSLILSSAAAMGAGAAPSAQVPAYPVLARAAERSSAGGLFRMPEVEINAAES